MLTEIYIEALLVDEDLADQVWEAWEIDDQAAFIAWWLIIFAQIAQNNILDIHQMPIFFTIFDPI